MSKPVPDATTRHIFLRAAEMIEEARGTDLKGARIQTAAYSLGNVLADLDGDKAYFETLGITREGANFLRGALATLEALQVSRAEDDDAQE